MADGIAVVGGGVMGTAIALALAETRAQRDGSIVLFERTALAAGSSGRSGAILRCMYADPQLVTMARDAARTYAGFAAETGLEIGYTRAGVLTLAGPGAPEWIARVRANVALLRSLDVACELLEAEGIRRLAPALVVEPGTVGAFEPEGGCVDPRRTVAAFARRACDLGVTLCTGVAVERLVLEHGRVVGLRTSDGELRFERVVVAGGPWTRALFARAGIELPLRIVRPENHFQVLPDAEAGFTPVGAEPSMEQLASALHAAPTPLGETLHPVLIDLDHGFYSRADPAYGRVRVGHIDHELEHELAEPDALDERVLPATVAWARERLAERVPRYRTQPDAGSQAAWYTLTPDQQPLLGPVPGVDGLFVATGFSGHGFKLAPAVGAGMGQLVRGEQVSAFDAAFFSPARFERRASPAAAGKAFGL